MPANAAPAAGLASDSALGKSLGRYGLESIRAPTLVASVREDGYGTYAGAQYTASQIQGAKFFGFDDGGHTWVGHDEEVRVEILKLLTDKAVAGNGKPDPGAPTAAHRPTSAYR